MYLTNWGYNRYSPLLESSGYDMDSGNADYIEKMGEIDIIDFKNPGKTIRVKTVDIMKVVADGIYKMQRDYSYLYNFMRKCKLMYMPEYPSEVCETMMVDSDNNLWVNLHYVYNVCAMDSNRVFGILFHEMFHVFFDHILRFRELYPAEMFKGMPRSVYKKANMKANICMDYEVNASMVEDGIVAKDFWKNMNGLYKDEYTGMTWEEIMHKAGDSEYEDWLKRNGFSLDDVELKVLKAIEKASKTLLDPESDDDDKRAARKQLKKDLDNILGKDTSGEKSLDDILEDMQNTKLGDIGRIAQDLDDVMDDLHKDPAGMSDAELDKTLSDIDKLMDEMDDKAEEVGDQFNKSADDVKNDVAKSRESFKDAMKKMHEGGLSRDEKQDLMDKLKDDLEDIISDDLEKKKLEEKRKARDEKKEAERKERFKKTHPIRSLIKVINNLAELREVDLVSGDTVDILNKISSELEPLTELHFSEMGESDFRDVREDFDTLKESLLPDLVELIKNDTILNKDEDDMKRLLDGVFKYVQEAFDTALRDDLDESKRGSMFPTAAQKLRIIGKVLKTQKVWKTSEEFKDAYMSTMKELIEMLKTDGKEAVFNKLADMGAIDPRALDKEGKDLFDKWMASKRKTKIIK